MLRLLLIYLGINGYCKIIALTGKMLLSLYKIGMVELNYTIFV